MAERIRGAFENWQSNTTKQLQDTEAMKTLKQWERKFFAENHGNILSNTPRRRHPEHWNRLQELMATGDYHAAVFGYHPSHAAGIPAMEEANEIREKANEILPPNQHLQSSVILYAYNIRSGQAEELVDYFNLIEPTLSRLNVEPQLVIREKDKEAVSPDELQLNRHELHTTLSHLVERGQTPIVLPEGTVQAGRKKKNGYPGEINGIVPFQKNSVELITTHIRRQGKEPLLIFVAPTGAHTIYDPSTEKVTLEAKAKIIAGNMPFIASRLKPMMESTVGWPLPYSDIVRDFGEDGRLPKGLLEQLSGEIIADMLPVEERGEYRYPTLLQHMTTRRTKLHEAE